MALNALTPGLRGLRGDEPSAVSSAFGLRGDWNAGSSYKTNDLVSYLGSSYVAVRPSTNQAPMDGFGQVNVVYWQSNAQKGDAGTILYPYTSTTAGFVQPVEGGSVTINVLRNDWMSVGLNVYIESGGYYVVVSRLGGGTQVALQNLGYSDNAAPNTAIATNRLISPAGPRGAAGNTIPAVNAFTLSSADFIQPPVNSTVYITVVNSTWMSVGQTLYIGGAQTTPGGYYEITVINTPIQIQAKNLGILPTAVAPGGTVFSGQKVAPAGKQGNGGSSSSTITNTFTQPASGNSITVNLVNADWVTIGSFVFIEGAGTYKVTSLTNLQAVIQNLGLEGNAAPGVQVSAGAKIGSSGAQGPTSYSSVNTSFVQPSIGSSVTVSLKSTGWMFVGQVVSVQNGGFYSVYSISSDTVAVLVNLGYPSNVTVGTTVASGGKVVPGGDRGDSATAFTTVTSNFTQPAIASTVTITVGRTDWMLIGQVLLIANGGYYRINSIPSSTQVTIENTGITGNAAAGSTITANGKIVCAGERGAGAVSSITANYTQPTVGSTVTVTIDNISWMVAGAIVYVESTGFYLVTSVSSTTATLQNLGYPNSVPPATTVVSVKKIAPAGARGADGVSVVTNLAAAFTQPAVNSTVSATLISTAMLLVGQAIFIQGGGYYQVQAIASSTTATLQNLGYPANANSGATISSGSGLSIAGLRGANGADSFALTQAAFTQPTVGTTVNVTVDSTAWMAVGQTVFVETGGYYSIYSLPSATQVALQNLGYPINAAVNTSIATSKKLSPAGVMGPYSYTKTTVTFTQPAASSTVNVNVGSTEWMAVGQTLYVESGGFYQVNAIIAIDQVRLLNLGYPANTNAGGGISSGKMITPAGDRGASAAAATTLAANYVQPSVGASTTVTVADTGWIAVGQAIFIQGGGSYTVNSVNSATQIGIVNLGYAENTAVNNTVFSGSTIRVVATGRKGDTGVIDPRDQWLFS